ncbi:DUF5996 family protein [Planomicrobium sp. Y74]|uniref:DUF5996 family protein n=1 Tax=Planomicrobium sp. Y74 TaxID=2478977 RepID=UPI000EF4413A|nr:DUF5996 family protein [Planomicrobium sp. Y74]RLQ90092.1 hypothetical protein D9754_10135 [Planomicrobium sp. Y74]
MKIDVIRHSEWAGTKFTLHLISQILGKIKLETAQQEPQWAHVALDITPDGFSTGLLFTENQAFQVDTDIRNSRILINVEGDTQSISLEPSKSIKWYHDEIFSALSSRGIDLKINPKPQEMAYTTPMDEDDTPLEFDQQSAMEGLKLFQFALLEQRKFIAPMRCRKMKPALFWGTFDVSLLILPGIIEPFPEDRVIEKAAFDEQMIEYGFWLGDDQTEIPTFFVLPYPFQYNYLNSPSIKPSEAFYDETKSEYFLPLDAVAAKENPTAEIQEFFRSTFDALVDELNWQGCDYYFTPLKMKEQASGNQQ